MAPAQPRTIVTADHRIREATVTRTAAKFEQAHADDVRAERRLFSEANTIGQDNGVTTVTAATSTDDGRLTGLHIQTPAGMVELSGQQVAGLLDTLYLVAPEQYLNVAAVDLAGYYRTTAQRAGECEHVPTWDDMLGPIEDSDLMKERAQ